MDFELTISRVFENSLAKHYINDCCVGGDEVLNEFKDDIALEMSIDGDLIEIFQEDWGWKLEFLKDQMTYLLAVNNITELENGKSLFTAYAQATQKEQKMFFNKTVDANTELKTFSEIVLKLAKKNGFEVD